MKPKKFRNKKLVCKENENLCFLFKLKWNSFWTSDIARQVEFELDKKRNRKKSDSLKALMRLKLKAKDHSGFKGYANQEQLCIIGQFKAIVGINGNEIHDSFYVIKNGQRSLLGH